MTLLDRIPDSSRLYLLKYKRKDLPPRDVDFAHERLTAQDFALAARTELLNDDSGTLWIAFQSDVARMRRILYAWVLADTIVRIGSSDGIFYSRFFEAGNVMSGREKYVTPAIQAYPAQYRESGTQKDEAQLWVTLFRHGGGHGLIYAKCAEFVRPPGKKKPVCPEESVLLRRHRPALNRSLK